MDRDEKPPILPAPIFVGGVSRSGTTVVGKSLIGRHEDIAPTIPAEMWCITNTGGVTDMVGAQHSSSVRLRLWANAWRLRQPTPKAAFRHQMQGFWWSREWWRPGVQRGLFESVSWEQLSAALDDFEADFPRSPQPAARRLVADLIDPSVRARGKTRWVDTTPDNARSADGLYRVFPDMKLVYMLRDGRDVAASLVAMVWGPDDWFDALDHWYDTMRANHEAITRIPDDRVLPIQLEELLAGRRRRQYRRLVRFLEVEDSPKMLRFFKRRMDPAAGHVGRWRRELDEDMQTRIDLRYGEMLLKLDEIGAVRPHNIQARAKPH